MPVIGVFGTALYTIARGFEWWVLGLAAVMYFLVGLSITAGYHRLFSHRTYEASRAVEFFFAVFGALAAQNSILWWSASHRVHHRFVDRDWDPYNIQRGFWWAHIFWIFYKNPAAGDFSNSKDLLQNPVVMWQLRWHYVLMIVVGFGLPALVGAYFGDWVAGMLWGGFLRVFRPYRASVGEGAATRGGARSCRCSLCPGLICSCPFGAKRAMDQFLQRPFDTPTPRRGNDNPA